VFYHKKKSLKIFSLVVNKELLVKDREHVLVLADLCKDVGITE
jgi:hypothetical protein